MYLRGKKREELVGMHAAQALNNPNWNMGAKVTIDSASLVNKGLEVMEARWLFDVDVDHIQVVVQPQSILHSAVEYVDGSVMAQLASPDMHLPIQYALFYPDRMPLKIQPLDLFAVRDLHFERPDTETFRGLPLAYRAARAGGSMPTVFDAAGEEAVSRFMKDEIEFLDIYDLIEGAMDAHHVQENPTLDEILCAEQEARDYVRRAVSLVIIFSVIVIGHEFGHFAIARRNGIRVTEFDIGMGPLLWHKKRGDTDFCIRLLPVGGACIFDGADALADGVSEEEMDEHAYPRAGVFARMATVLGGPFMNFLLGFVFALIIVAFSGTDLPVVYQVQKDSAAQEAGIEAGDTITKINGEPIQNGEIRPKRSR